MLFLSGGQEGFCCDVSLVLGPGHRQSSKESMPLRTIIEGGQGHDGGLLFLKGRVKSWGKPKLASVKGDYLIGNLVRASVSLQPSLGIHIPLSMDHNLSLPLQATDGGENTNALCQSLMHCCLNWQDAKRNVGERPPVWRAGEGLGGWLGFLTQGLHVLGEGDNHREHHVAEASPEGAV